MPGWVNVENTKQVFLILTIGIMCVVFGLRISCPLYIAYNIMKKKDLIVYLCRIGYKTAGHIWKIMLQGKADFIPNKYTLFSTARSVRWRWCRYGNYLIAWPIRLKVCMYISSFTDIIYKYINFHHQACDSPGRRRYNPKRSEDWSLV